MSADRLIRMALPNGGTLSVKCPPWCTQPHKENDYAHWAWHEAPAIAFTGPGDYYGHFDDGEPYEVMWACLAAQPDDTTGDYGQPYIYFDTLSAGAGGRLDVAQADAYLTELRTYVDRLQQMRDRLAEITQQGEK
ncbi:DUF6907 domain-containing protein [Streptomyces sp. NPDC088915]|uniref:DUF6907 domain-containing protein n=1 Tax=Streptomyces sp. NPDC088915 TaxID=3365912 RepID=UPI003812D57D